FELPSPLQSQIEFSSFVTFFDFIETSQIKLSCGTHMAHIVYMISWLAYKMSKIEGINENRFDLFSIPIVKLISCMKLTVVLSSEVGSRTVSKESDEPWGGPWGTDTVVDTIALEFKRIIKYYHIMPSQTVLNTLDVRSGSFLSVWKARSDVTNILCQEPVSSPMNPHTDYFSGFVGIGVNDKSPESTIYRVSSSYGGIKWEKTERDSAAYTIINSFDAYYVISPDKSLRQDQCEEKSILAKYLEEKLWLDGKLWKHVGDVVVERLKPRRFFMYAGHGNDVELDFKLSGNNSRSWK
nr:hypothetical protein [Tanacetum cinerariifolium]